MPVKHWLISILALIVLQGCVIVPPPPSRHGPPDHAPAHGYRAKYRYYYYPDAAVYFDLDRRLYFYLDGGWRRAERLPRDLYVRLGGPVALTLDLDEPYHRHDEHRRSHPPGQGRKKNKKW